MNRISKIWPPILGGVAALLLSTGLWAMPPGGGMGGGMMGGDPDRMLRHMTSRLELTEEQQQKVQAILEDSRKASTADISQLQELRSQLAPLGETFDATRAREVADKIGALTGSMVYRATETHAQIYQLLDDQQKAKMQGMMQERETRRDKMKSSGPGGVQ